MEKERIVIIDGNSLINRAFYALPPLTTKEGQHTNAIYGFMTMLFKVIEEYKPQYIGVAFDKKAPTFRHKEYGDYKAGRKKMPQELAEQMEPLKEILDVLSIYRIEIEGFEADDLIGTLAKYCEGKDFESLIVTGDKDALQLASPNTKVLFTKKGISNLEIYDDKKVMEDFQVTPLQFIDLKGLMGDKSDNIPGVPGIGEKTAVKLIKEFGSVENLVQNTEKISAAKLREKIETNKQQAILSKRLATIVTNVPVDIHVDHLKVEAFEKEKVLKIFNKYEFNSLINKLVETHREENTEKNYEKENGMAIVDIKDLKALNQMLQDIEVSKKIILKSITEEKNIVNNKIIAIGIGIIEGKQYYIDLRDFENKDKVLQQLKPLLEDETIEKISHDVKKELLHFYPYDIQIKNFIFDTMIGEYLIDPSKSSYSIKELGAQYFGESLLEEEELVGKGKSQIDRADIPREKLKTYLGQQVEVSYRLKDLLEKKIIELELTALYYEVELPLTEVLASMEFRGIKVDKHMLEDLKIEFKNRVDHLTTEIYDLAGEVFNINSPKQLGEILFDKLQLPPIKKTKTGYSTNVEVLEKLHDKHDIIPKILEYRQVTKLKTTYIDGLLNIINPITGRIHSSFHQTVTTTGRISSTEPNLQNIPIKLEMGRGLRKVFRAEEGHKLIDADYSQIELRVLAHISEDKNLLESFLQDQDVHTRTASEIFNVPIEEVTSSMRSSAKAVNFGIVYGISDFGLAENLNISRYHAKKYIDSYLEKYASVQKYMEDAVRTAKERGYVLTLLNRRRYLPEVHSRNFNLRSFGERVAMNTPIQGSAADIIKIAMVKVYKRLKEGNFKSKLILQVHDELIVEAMDSELEKVSSIVKESMEEAMTIKVPLKVDLAYGETWYDTK
ncbi:DNA polymerase I [Clostridium formicaceticum]|uniref:DNA polymerase I n=1 Tax=Clostridium formicaceticum TaxID=1497 RepID=A0AAC9RKS1_9CLOT|nr:DNA polymerase I [Clostridium formicaceticum]AOY76710.1 DNA polymerase I [Clostridium formicaceticum]ARE87145.1 DNA polymerase I [Clostridium formicaceticum]